MHNSGDIILVLTNQAPGEIRLASISKPVHPERLQKQEVSEKISNVEFKGSVDQTWKIASFTYSTNIHKFQLAEVTPIRENDETGDICFFIRQALLEKIC